MSPFSRILFAGLSTLTVLVLLFGYHTSTSGPSGNLTAGSNPPAISGSAAGSSSGSASPPEGDTTSPSTTPKSTPQTTAPKAATPKTSTVTGPSTPTQWGPVQVQVTVDGSTITDVTVVQYPMGNGTDQQINSYALPILIQETLDAQSAQIDMISGATVTSRGYLTSLQAALDQALA